ncbi:MAG TPA: hypothetical protein VJ998_12835, partial [Pseudomonadales bacterium]|nr:hypothetical protein [Pseudomonadales bacterium]
LDAIAAERSELDASWAELWSSCQIIPRTPREMQAWSNEFEKLRDRAGQLNLLRQKLSEIEQNRRSFILLLNEQLSELGKEGSTSNELESVLIECEALARKLDGSKRKRDSLVKEVKDREADAESLIKYRAY